MTPELSSGGVDLRGKLAADEAYALAQATAEPLLEEGRRQGRAAAIAELRSAFKNTGYPAAKWAADYLSAGALKPVAIIEPSQAEPDDDYRTASRWMEGRGARP